MKPCVAKPCTHCAFNRNSVPGDLGGSAAEVYIGQAHGPFYVPCHLQYKDRTMEQVRDDTTQIHQCAGLAVFRANIGMDKFMPEPFTRLPKDTKNVFASPAEFLAHHKRISLYRAMQELAVRPPAALLREQLASDRVKLIPIQKD